MQGALWKFVKQKQTSYWTLVPGCKAASEFVTCLQGAHSLCPKIDLTILPHNTWKKNDISNNTCRLFSFPTVNTNTIFIVHNVHTHYYWHRYRQYLLSRYFVIAYNSAQSWLQISKVQKGWPSDASWWNSEEGNLTTTKTHMLQIWHDQVYNLGP